MSFYDADTNILFLVGKGDTTTRYFEATEDANCLSLIGTFTDLSPQKGAAMLPKRSLDVMDCEIARLLRVTASGIEPVKFEVPRRTKTVFHEELYPDTTSGEPAIDASRWFAGENAAPLLVSLRPHGVVVASSADALETKVEEKSDEAEETPEQAAEREARTKRFAHLGSSGSKYRHAHGTALKKDLTFFNIQPDVSAIDSNIIQANNQFIAFPYRGAGGPVLVHPLNKPGKVFSCLYCFSPPFHSISGFHLIPLSSPPLICY